MRTYETPYTADWFAISLRWAVMLGCVVSLALGDVLIWPLFWPIGLMAVWNMGMTVLAGLNTRINYHRQISLAVDILLSGIFVWLQGGLAGPVAWAGLLPILTGAVYLEYWGALISAALFAALSMANAYSYIRSFSYRQWLGGNIPGTWRVVRIPRPATGNPFTCRAPEMARGRKQENTRSKANACVPSMN